MKSTELLQMLAEGLADGVNSLSAQDIESEIKKLADSLQNAPEGAKIAIIARLIEDYSMSGSFSGQSSDMPNYFSDSEWAEIEGQSHQSWRDFCPLDLLSEGWMAI